MQQGHVYIFYSIDLDLFKIGESDNPERREKQGETWLPSGIKVIEIYPFINKRIAQTKESYLHLKYSRKRVNKNREWFRLDDVDIIAIDEYLRGGGRMSIPRKIILKTRLKILNLREVFLKLF